MIHQFHADYTGFVGTTSTNDSRGVYRIGMDAESGEIRILDVQPMYNSGYLAVSPDNRRLYVLSEGMTFRGRASGGITAFDITEDRFAPLGWAWTDGQRPCFVACDADSGEIYVGNFFNGTICVFAPDERCGVGERRYYLTHPKVGPMRPGIHCVAKCPTGRWLLSLELSADGIYVYDAEDNFRIVGRERMPEGSMPRHMVFTPDGRFVCLNRQGDEKVSVYAFRPEENPMLIPVQTLSVRSEDMAGKTEPAAIRFCPGQPLLAVSNRGQGTRYREDSVTLFSQDPASGLLTREQVIRLGGEMPRDVNFTPDGRFLVVGYQFQGYLDVYRVDAESRRLTYVGRGGDIPSPVCIAFRKDGDNCG